MCCRSHITFHSACLAFKTFAFALALCCPKVHAQQEFCVVASDVSSEPVEALSEANLGLVTIHEAIPSAGGSAPLDVIDCSLDGGLDVAIPWSGETASQYAAIRISPNSCGGRPPEIVAIPLRHTAYCVLHGLNETGEVVASVTAGAHSFPQSLLLSSSSGMGCTTLNKNLLLSKSSGYPRQLSRPAQIRWDSRTLLDPRPEPVRQEVMQFFPIHPGNLAMWRVRLFSDTTKERVLP